MNLRKYRPRNNTGAPVAPVESYTAQAETGATLQQVALSMPLPSREQVQKKRVFTSAEKDFVFQPDGEYHFEDFARDENYKLIVPDEWHRGLYEWWVELFRRGKVDISDTGAVLQVMTAAEAIGVDPFSGSRGCKK